MPTVSVNPSTCCSRLALRPSYVTVYCTNNGRTSCSCQARHSHGWPPFFATDGRALEAPHWTRGSGALCMVHHKPRETVPRQPETLRIIVISVLVLTSCVGYHCLLPDFDRRPRHKSHVITFTHPLA
ncbi:hypothetical protein BC834DRAFT_133812 [Gloeopeniophorella convolvens]|nr:hypothetical protein BC834DRAFT_133812 [Gloeopeniophorella convolvens]